MKLTFLIGNGFDLRLGMKTKFAHMYEGYTSITPKDDKIIREFKTALKKDSPNYETWSDFEMGMAQYAKNYDNPDDFIKCIRNFKAYMIDYLKKEEKAFKEQYLNSGETERDIQAEFKRSLTKFYFDESPNVKNYIEFFLNKDSTFICNFITFNYTKIIELLISRYSQFYRVSYDNVRLGDIIHIHGTLDGDVVLGVDNEAQLKDIKFSINKSIERAFIKPKFNEMFDNTRTYMAKSIIKSSNVICIYGLSMGESDLTWKKVVVDWLLSDCNNQMFYFVYGTTPYASWNVDGKMDEEDRLKYKLLKKICSSEKEIEDIFDQVHIPIGSDIFGIYDLMSNDKSSNDSNKEKVLALT